MHRFKAGDYLPVFLLVTSIVAFVSYVAVYRAGLAEAPIRSDGYSYYMYLPAWFLFGDPTLDAVARDCCGGTMPSFSEIRRWPETNRWVNPHPIGVAVLVAPFFAVAHALTRWSNLPPDGFSFYYQHAAGLAGVAALVFGLWSLGRLLSRHFDQHVTLATLVTITFGTNLFHYGVYESTFSHVFSFALVARLLDAIDQWSRRDRATVPLEAAVVAALIVLVRHTNALFLLVPLVAYAQTWQARRREAVAAAAIALLCVTPQLVIYKQATGHWLVSAYSQVGAFTFQSPHLWGVLFGVQKGLFFWSPVLLVAIAGAFVHHAWTMRFRTVVAIVLAIDAYVIASWFDWQLGASYGHRGFTDALPFFAIFIAAAFDAVSRRRLLVVPAIVIVSLLVALSVVQMIQYWVGIIPLANTTWAQYRALFLRFR